MSEHDQPSRKQRQASARKQRLAEQLRANLRKRKTRQKSKSAAATPVKQ